ncbi:MAG: hypothetical protein ABJA16_05150 [Nakamurella sp.]
MSSAAASGIRTRSQVEFDNSDVLIVTGPAATPGSVGSGDALMCCAAAQIFRRIVPGHDIS